MTLNDVMVLIFALFHRIRVYDVVVKQLLGLYLGFKIYLW